MKAITFISFLFAFSVISYGESDTLITNKNKAILLLVNKEQTIEALKLFTSEIQQSSHKNNTHQISDNIYWIAECFFRLKKLAELKLLLSRCSDYIQKYNYESFIKLKIIEGKYLIEEGKLNASIVILKKLSKKTTDKTSRCEIQLTLADAYQRIQTLEKSKYYYIQVIENTHDKIQLARAYNGLGSYYCMQSNLDTAKKYYLIAYNQFCKLFGDMHSRTAQVEYNLGLVADRIGDFGESEKYFLNALSVFKAKLGNLHPRTAEVYGALGSLYLLKDNPGKALNYSVKERDILIALYGKTHPDLIYSYLNCGKIFYLLNELNQSEEQLKSALELTNSFYGKKHNMHSQCIVELSKIYTQRQEYTEAAKILSNTILSKQNEPDDYLADIYLQAGENYFLQNQYKDAIQQYKNAIALYEDFYGRKSMYLIEPLLGISEVYLKQNNVYSAISYANKALSLTKEKQKIVFPNEYWICMVQLFQCKKMLYTFQLPSMQDAATEIELIKKTLTYATQIRNTFYHTGSQLYFTDKMTILNQLGIYFLLKFYKKKDNYYANNLLFFSENNKANLLRSKIINYKAIEILPSKVKATSSYILGKLNYFTNLEEDKTSTVFNINDSVLFYQDKYESFTKAIEKKYPKIYSLKYGNRSIAVKDIQKRIKKNECFLEYFNDGENYYCLSISTQNIIIKNCGNKYNIDTTIATYLTSVNRKSADEKLSNLLYRKLLPEKKPELILISPDEQLQQLSFDALLNNQKEYLVKQHAIHYAVSANTYFNTQNISNDKKIIGFYPDFINSKYAVLNHQREDAILKSHNNYSVFQDKDATKNNFIKNLSNAGIIHVCSHILIDSVSPMQSSLVFQPGNNYLLKINEIWKLNVNAQLITLAACQSNFGKVQKGEGLQNFTWAFQYAGIHHVLATLWNASDRSTSAICSSFYTFLKNGASKENALQLAKLSYLNHSDAIGAQPYYWANFYLSGDNSDIEISDCFLAKFWWLPVLLLLLCYLAFLKTSKTIRKDV